jgi:hypothetical protein
MAIPAAGLDHAVGVGIATGPVTGNEVQGGKARFIARQLTVMLASIPSWIWQTYV